MFAALFAFSIHDISVIME